jgi:ribosomal protein L16 Arg81 hydroxylase
MQCVLQPGDMIFVPAGTAHQVANTEAVIALSGNYVDHTNVLHAVRIARELNERDTNTNEEWIALENGVRAAAGMRTIDTSWLPHVCPAVDVHAGLLV